MFSTSNLAGLMFCTYFWHRLTSAGLTIQISKAQFLANNLNYDPRTQRFKVVFLQRSDDRGLDYVHFSNIRKTPVLAAFWQSFTGSSPWRKAATIGPIGESPKQKPRSTELSVNAKVDCLNILVSQQSSGNGILQKWCFVILWSTKQILCRKLQSFIICIYNI